MPTRTITEEDETRYRREFGLAIRETRLDRGETQEEVARAVGVALSVYRSWEKGRATPRGLAMLRLCQHLGWAFPVVIDMGVNRPYPLTADDLRVYALAPSVIEDHPTGKRVAV